MRYKVTARVKQDRSDGFEVLTPDLKSAIDVAKDVRLRHKDMLVQVRDPSGKILPLFDEPTSRQATASPIAAR